VLANSIPEVPWILAVGNEGVSYGECNNMIME